MLKAKPQVLSYQEIIKRNIEDKDDERQYIKKRI
jgi:hypothetical protein